MVVRMIVRMVMSVIVALVVMAVVVIVVVIAGITGDAHHCGFPIVESNIEFAQLALNTCQLNGQC